MLREDGGYVLRFDGGRILREAAIPGDNVLREDGGYVLRFDGGRIVREGEAAPAVPDGALLDAEGSSSPMLDTTGEYILGV